MVKTKVLKLFIKLKLLEIYRIKKIISFCVPLKENTKILYSLIQQNNPCAASIKSTIRERFSPKPTKTRNLYHVNNNVTNILLLYKFTKGLINTIPILHHLEECKVLVFLPVQCTGLFIIIIMNYIF